MNRSTGFLERLSVAAREPIYSAAIAWLFDDCGSPLTMEERKSILSDFAGIKIDGSCEITTFTEWHDIDILLTIETKAGTEYLAVENKIKSFESPEQLNKYDEKLKELGSDRISKIFLTLTGETPISGSGWRSVSYETLLTAIRSHSISRKNPFVDDLCLAIQKLVELAKATNENSDLASFAFGDEDEASVPIKSADYAIFTEYMEKMRLKKVVQRIWMANLVSALEIQSGWRVIVGESNGQALLDIEAELKNHSRFFIGVQIQNHAMKAYCVRRPYPKKASKREKQIAGEVLLKMQTRMKFSSKISEGKVRGFRSFTIPIPPYNRIVEDWAAKIAPQLRHFFESNKDSVVTRK